MFKLRLDKEYFHFCAAHFVIFDAVHKEPLHGHNYRVAIEISGSSLNDGKLVDISQLKRDVRALCDSLDHTLLLPATNPYLELETLGSQLRVSFGDVRYEFPTAEVHVLPVDNVTMENLAVYIHEQLSKQWEIQLANLSALTVEVSETRGQHAAICCQ